jgi:ABC-type multidrug transport system ATPase subunit
LLVELSRDRIVIFSTHIIEDISSSCNQVAVVQKGELKYFGTPADMNSIAQDKVWQFTVPVEEFAEYEKSLTVVHHMRDGDSIRIRCISNEVPHKDAVRENPVLEDAYLCLLKGLNKTSNKPEGGENE